MKTQRQIVVLVLLVLGLAGIAAAQNKKEDKKREAQLRTVHGQVIDKDENPVSGGVVYLRNLKTQVVKTYSSEQDGRYRFSGLDPNVDYEIHAEFKALTSKTRTISSLDGSREIVINLKVDKKKD